MHRISSSRAVPVGAAHHLTHLSHLPAPSRRQALRQWGALASAALLPSGLPAWAAVAQTRRLVSVGGGLTEIVYALGAEAELVGVDTTSLYPAQAQKLPSVGYARTLSVEGVLALAPTLVIATEDAGPPAVLRQLVSSGIAVSTLSANHRFEGLIERVQRVGELTGRVAQAKQMAHSLQQAWVRAQAPIAQRGGTPPRVLFVLAHTPNQIMVAGSATSAQAMLEYVGARNAVTGFAGFKPLTPEAVIAAQPDVVLLTDQGLQATGGMEAIFKLPGLAQTPAGRQRRVIALEAMFLLGFGPRLPEAVSALDAAVVQVMRT